jgi:CRP-like cAMP-binding protein
MDTPRVVDIGELELFAGCTKAELRKIRSLTTYVQVPKDQVLMREGSAAHEFIIIDSGTASVSRRTHEGVAKVADVGSGGFLGEMALLNGTPRTATATATTDLGLLVSSASEFRSILRIAPSVAEKVRHASVARSGSLDLANAA